MHGMMTPASASFADVPQLPRGLFRLDVFHRGVLVETVAAGNLVVDTARTWLSQLAGSLDPNSQVTRLGVGTDGTPAAAGNTTLTSPFLKALDGAPTYPTPGQVQFRFSLAPTEANGLLIAEFALVTAGGGLFARKTRAAPLLKTPDLSLSGTWLLSF